MIPDRHILAIDPGTACGWAVHNGSVVVASGVWNLKPNRFQGGGMRYVLLHGFLDDIAKSFPIAIVSYEEVRKHLGVDAAHIYGGIVSVIQAWCESAPGGLPYQGIPVGSIKKFATGKGNANKEAMLAAARAQWPDADISDYNEADARWIATYSALHTPGVDELLNVPPEAGESDPPEADRVRPASVRLRRKSPQPISAPAECDPRTGEL